MSLRGCRCRVISFTSCPALVAAAVYCLSLASVLFVSLVVCCPCRCFSWPCVPAAAHDCRCCCSIGCRKSCFHATHWFDPLTTPGSETTVLTARNAETHSARLPITAGTSSHSHSNGAVSITHTWGTGAPGPSCFHTAGCPSSRLLLVLVDQLVQCFVGLNHLVCH